MERTQLQEQLQRDEESNMIYGGGFRKEMSSLEMLQEKMMLRESSIIDRVEELKKKN